jgi:hypothetical protein
MSQYDFFFRYSGTAVIITKTTTTTQQQAISNELIKSHSAKSLNTNKPVTIANTNGQVILLNSWAT